VQLARTWVIQCPRAVFQAIPGWRSRADDSVAAPEAAIVRHRAIADEMFML